MTEVVVTAGARRHAKLQSNRHQQTNTQLYTQANVYFLFNCNSLRKCVVYEQEAEVASFFLHKVAVQVSLSAIFVANQGR